MLRILWNSKSNMMANQEKLDAISNNLSNVNTEGYKKLDVTFKDLVYESLNRKGYPMSENNDRANDPFTGSGVRASEWIRDQKQGFLIETKKTTDFAIDGEGYFQVRRSNGDIAYTRAGKFNVDSMGRMVDTQGNILNIKFNEGFNDENVKFTKDNFSINEAGSIGLKVGDEFEEVGKIQIYNAIGNNSFRSIGESLYVPNEGVQIYEVNDSNVLQGFIESSNVDMVAEMTDMLVTQRAFELGSKGIKTADEMWGIANNLRGK